jgi:hypothetical protein
VKPWFQLPGSSGFVRLLHNCAPLVGEKQGFPGGKFKDLLVY